MVTKNAKKAETQNDIPAFIPAAMQGLVFWIGHRKAIYRHWQLQESALVAEFVNLLMANNNENFSLLCEENYLKLFPKLKISDVITKNARVDICVSEKLKKIESKESQKKPLFIIEVKRGETEIKKDLLRLAEIKKHEPKIKCFLLVISENKLPKKYVDPKTGESYKEKEKRKIKIDNGKLTGFVKFVKKASKTFKNKMFAHYCCLIEVKPTTKGKK